jgi:hypothetical protein
MRARSTAVLPMMTKKPPKCSRCDDVGWVCENYTDKPWHVGPGGCMCGAGAPCPAPFCTIPRSIYEEARDVARALAKTKAFEQSRRERKRVEMLFAHLKRILRLARLRLLGLGRPKRE